MVSKGYGLTVSEIDESCPTDLHGLTSFLVRMNNTLLISAAFKGISLARKVKA